MNWISVKDRLPEKVGEYLVFSNIHNLIDEISKAEFVIQALGKASIGFGFWIIDGDEETDLADSVTHWQPLPEPPKD